jgi:phosphoglycerate-specific signal transduction histidine kinase
MFYDFYKEKLLLIGNLTPNLIHDIRNSLSVLKLNYYYLNLKEKSIPAEIASSLNDCSEAISRLEKKLDHFSLLTSNNESSLEVCSLNTLISVAIDLLKGKAKRNNISFEDISAANVPTLKMNKSKVSVSVIGILNSLIDIGFLNQKILLNTFEVGSQNLCVEIEKQIKNESDVPVENANAGDNFMNEIKELNELLNVDRIKIIFIGNISGDCKITFLFTK